jgi:hypothetical protein
MLGFALWPPVEVRLRPVTIGADGQPPVQVRLRPVTIGADGQHGMPGAALAKAPGQASGLLSRTGVFGDDVAGR